MEKRWHEKKVDTYRPSTHGKDSKEMTDLEVYMYSYGHLPSATLRKMLILGSIEGTRKDAIHMLLNTPRMTRRRVHKREYVEMPL